MGTPSHHLHINAPELLSGRERTRDVVITAVMWSFYLYLWMPLISLFAWLFGFDLAYEIMIEKGGSQHLGTVVLVYGSVVGAIFATVSMWSIGNRLRYGKLKRRSVAEPVSVEQMADHFDVDIEVIEQLRMTPSVSIEFTPEGHTVIKRYEAIRVSELLQASDAVVPLRKTGRNADSKRHADDELSA